MTAALLWLPAMLAMDAPRTLESKDIPHWLVGNWSGTGALFGQPAKMTLSICPLAGNQGLTLNYQVTGEGSSAMRFAGHADYVPDGENRWRGRWMGSNGTDHDLTALVSNRSFIATWQNAAVETGRTRYQRIAPGQLRVTDHVLREGERFEQFASADYRRKSVCQDMSDNHQ